MAELNVRKRGTKWEYRFECAKVDGKRKQVSKSGFLTKKEAEHVSLIVNGPFWNIVSSANQYRFLELCLIQEL